MFSEDVRYRYFINLSDYLIKEYSAISKNGVVIWGTGAFGEFINSLYKAMNKGDDVRCFCCSNEDESLPKFFDGIKIFSPLNALQQFPSATFIIASSYRREILSSIKNQKLDICSLYLPNDSLLKSKFTIIEYVKKLCSK